MFGEGFFHRFRKSFDRVLYGFDLIISAVVILFLFIAMGEGIASHDLQTFVDMSTSLANSLVVIIITGIAIFVSLSNSEAMKALKERKLYERFLFTFEFTAMLALIVSVFGMVLSTYSFGINIFYIFTGLVVYMVLATATVISRLITYGDKMAQIVVIESLPDDIGEKLTTRNEDDDEQENDFQASDTVIERT